jgi:hypothetical protein
MDNLPLLRQINQEIEDYRNKQITIVPGLTHNQWDTLQRIFHYYNSRFSQSGGSQLDPTDDEGDRMYFYNINRNPCKVFTKAIDFDTKNIRLLTTGGGDSLKTWFMERDLKFWMRDKQFGKVLNRLFRELPIYGSVVLKIVDGYPYFVDLRNFIVEQSADDLDSMNYITEIHNLTESQFRKIGKQMKWEQALIDETVSQFRQMRGVSHIRLYERYGTVTITDSKGNKTYPYRRTFLADVGVDEFDQRGDLKAEHTGIELSSMDFEGHPYWEFHAEKLSGRWLGVGVVETLFEPQIRHNQIANLQSKASFWMALHVFQTRDPAFARNISTDTRNGEVLNSESEVSEIVINDRNLAHFNDEFNKWMTNRDEMTFSFDVVRGERLPAGTPLGSAQIAQNQTMSYFDQIQEEVALQIKEMLFTDIIPKFAEDRSDEHTLRLVGQDLDEYVQMIKNDLVNKEVVRLAIQSVSGNKPFPTSQDRDAIEMAISESIKQGGEKLLDIPKDFYKGIKYDVDIDITGESMDTRVRQATIFAMLQAITSDPTMTQDPLKKKMLFWMAENGGINPNDLFGVESKQPQNLVPQEGRAGGGVSAPALGSAIPGMNSQQI